MPATRPTNKRRFNVTISRTGGSVGPVTTVWTDVHGGAVDFPQLPVVPDWAKAATGPLGGPTLRGLVLRRPLSPGPDGAGGPFLEHVAAVLGGSLPSPLDIAVEETDASGRQPVRRLVYREAYLKRWRIDVLDLASRNALTEEFEFVASDLQILR